MAELYIFSQDDKLLTIISESTGLTSAPFRDELNSVSEEPFVFTVEADTEKAKFVADENRVVFRDREGRFREFVIKELDDVDGMEGPETQATCLPAWFDELNEHYVLDKRYTDKEAQLALNDAVAGTRYVGIVEGELGLASTNFYRLLSVDSIWKIRDTWGGDITDEVELTNGRISKRKMILKLRMGADKGLRFEIDHNIEEIQRTVLSYPLTAMYGWGASLETENDGHTRYIDFSDVEWKVSNGDPVDKPLGQKWVGDPDALLEYGRLHQGQLLHRFGEFSNRDYEEKEELLWATWQSLQIAKKPEVNYRLKADLLDKPAALGDTAIAIDREFARPIEIQNRIIAIEYDLLDIENTTFVEFGQFLSVNEDDVRRDIDDLKESVNRPKPTRPIDNGSFPDIKPGTPSNVTADGAFQTIQLFWDYDSKVYISHYEVYGSQVSDFVPDDQHLLYRGRVSAFSHEVETDQTWYYYIGAVNTRGTVGEFSDRVKGSSVRVLTDDIVFGAVTSDLLADLAVTEDKIDALAVKTQHIDNLAVDSFHLKSGIIDNVHIVDASIEHTKMKSLNVDQVVAGEMDLVHLRSGTIDTDKFTVRGGSSNDYTEIKGSKLVSRGQFKRTWLGSTTNYDVKTKLENGYVRFRNDSLQRSLYFSEFGISTYVDGSGEANDSNGSSGSIYWWDTDYSSAGSKGITMHSHAGSPVLASNLNNVILHPHADKGIRHFTFTKSLDGNNGYLTFGNMTRQAGLRFVSTTRGEIEVTNNDSESGGSTSIRAGNGDFNTIVNSGNIELRTHVGDGGIRSFRFTKSTEDSAGVRRDGYIVFGNNDLKAGLRFSHVTNGRVEVVDSDYSTGGNTEIIAGRGSFNYVRRRTGNSYLNFISNTDNFLRIGVDGGNSRRLASSAIYNRTYSSGANMHITGEYTLGRSTSASKYKNAIRKQFESDEDQLNHSLNILKLNPSSWYDKYECDTYAEEIEQGHKLSDDDFKIKRHVGLIAEDVERVGLIENVVYNKGELEEIAYDRLWIHLIPVVDDHRNRIEILELENQYLKQKIKQLEENAA